MSTDPGTGMTPDDLLDTVGDLQNDVAAVEHRLRVLGRIADARLAEIARLRAAIKGFGDFGEGLAQPFGGRSKHVITAGKILVDMAAKALKETTMASDWHDIHPELQGIVSDPHGPSRSALLCLGCGRLPPHTGAEAICPACLPPNGTCDCPGCALVKPYRDALEVLAEEARAMMATDPTKAPVHLLSLAEFAEKQIASPAPQTPAPTGGRCCSCGYDGEAETPCEKREDETHCDHWWDGPDDEELCACDHSRDAHGGPYGEGPCAFGHGACPCASFTPAAPQTPAPTGPGKEE
jgi:hypothetical protein